MAFSILKFRIMLGFASAFIYLAQIFVLVGLTTNFWLEIRDRNRNIDDVEMHFGLHRVCWSRSDRCNNPTGNYDRKNLLPVVQALVISGSVFGLGASIVSLVNLFREMLELRLKVTSIATIILCFFSGIALMVACGVFGERIEISRDYGTEFERYAYLGYSFGLTTCAGGMMWISAIVIGIANFAGKEDEEMTKSHQPPPYTPGPPSVIMSAPSYRAPSVSSYRY